MNSSLYDKMPSKVIMPICSSSEGYHLDFVFDVDKKLYLSLVSKKDNLVYDYHHMKTKVDYLQFIDIISSARASGFATTIDTNPKCDPFMPFTCDTRKIDPVLTIDSRNNPHYLIIKHDTHRHLEDNYITLILECGRRMRLLSEDVKKLLSYHTQIQKIYNTLM